MIYFGKIRPITSRTQPIPYEMRNPHYTDERFTRKSGGLTIYLAEGLVLAKDDFGDEHVKGAHYNHSDVISQYFGYDEVRRAHEEAREAVDNNDTAAYYEAMLQNVYGDPSTILQHIIAGVNVGNGNPYHVYGTVSGSSPDPTSR